MASVVLILVGSAPRAYSKLKRGTLKALTNPSPLHNQLLSFPKLQAAQAYVKIPNVFHSKIIVKAKRR